MGAASHQSSSAHSLPYARGWLVRLFALPAIKASQQCHVDRQHVPHFGRRVARHFARRACAVTITRVLMCNRLGIIVIPCGCICLNADNAASHSNSGLHALTACGCCIQGAEWRVSEASHAKGTGAHMQPLIAGALQCKAARCRAPGPPSQSIRYSMYSILV